MLHAIRGLAILQYHYTAHHPLGFRLKTKTELKGRLHQLAKTDDAYGASAADFQLRLLLRTLINNHSWIKMPKNAFLPKSIINIFFLPSTCWKQELIFYTFLMHTNNALLRIKTGTNYTLSKKQTSNLGGAEREVYQLVIALVCRLPNAHTG
jgi:hypothetical protein